MSRSLAILFGHALLFVLAFGSVLDIRVADSADDVGISSPSALITAWGTSAESDPPIEHGSTSPGTTTVEPQAGEPGRHWSPTWRAPRQRNVLNIAPKRPPPAFGRARS